jgi:hypothetical protein
MEISAAKKIIEGLLRDQIKPAVLVNVVVQEDSDTDGDPILNVRAVYDSTQSSPKADKMLSASVLLRLNLRLAGEQRFPLLAFVSSDDEKEIAA